MADKIFFSYSRFDSVFVLRLANDMRNAGANVWLDQLDIAPGKRWDSEIEKALNEANCVLAIISPKSLASDNAMDEISYALEEKKKVIPVLLTNTETPFRLRRLQRVDFTGDYDTGFRQLLLALQLEKPIPFIKETVQQSGDNIQHAENNEELWEVCCSNNTVASYQQYLRTTLSKEHLNEAWQRLDVLQEKPLSRAIKLPQAGKETGSVRNKKNMLIVALVIPLAAIAFGAYKMINKAVPEKNVPLQVVRITQPEKATQPDKLPDTAALQTTPALINNSKAHIQEPAKPVQKKKASVQETGKQNTSIAVPGKEITPRDTNEMLPSMPSAETAVTETPVSAKKEMIVNSKLVVNLLLIDNPDMHERKKTDQPVRFSVINDIIYEGELIIRKGAIAKGTLTIGRIQTDIAIDKVDGAHGNIIYLKSEKSHGHRSDVETKRTYTAIIKPGTHIKY